MLLRVLILACVTSCSAGCLRWDSATQSLIPDTPAFPIDESGHAVVPNGVTSLASGAFNECGTLESVSLPATLQSIGSNAFKACTKLTSVDIPVSVTSLSCCAFKGSGLVSLTVPPLVSEIPEDFCYACSSLISVNFPPSVQSIGTFAFGGTPLAEVTVPFGCSVGANAFSVATTVIFAPPLSPPSPPTIDGAVVELTGVSPKIVFGGVDAPICTLSLDRGDSRLLSTCPIHDGRRRLGEADFVLTEEFNALKEEVADLRRLVDELQMKV